MGASENSSNEQKSSLAQLPLEKKKENTSLLQDNHQIVLLEIWPYLFLIRDTQHASLTSKNLIYEVSGETKFDQLYSILSSAQKPVPGALIYELLLCKEPTEKEDLKKVSRLISRLKSEKNIAIEYRKGAYSITQQKISKAS